MTGDVPLDLPGGTAAQGPYRVLARKYRPRTFADLMGQDALVRTLTNAITSGRIHQAYMLTGVRGVGKTTTARIIARALNCVGPEGTGGPTVTPCGVCDNCVAILGDRHVDVLEMDAASNTGVDNIREIIESARLSPMRARHKVFIVDEVHMLSKGAFNALLKTLEEPPAHVKFIFATTEIRKVPVTVLSRCQRFDLKRLDASVLMALFTKVAAAEAIPVEAEALQLIARAADGSARDGLSLLDQAMALAAGAVTAQQVRDMLGLTDRSVVIDLFAAAMSGRPADALAILADLHRSGADPIVVVQDLLDVVHGLTRLKVIPALAEDAATPEAERTRGADLAGTLTIPVLTRTWQMLLKGLGEVTQSPMPQQAAEMVIIRIAHAADLPPPGDIVRQLTQGGMVPAAGPGPAPAPGPGPGPRMTVEPGRPRAVGDASPAPAMVAAPAADALADPKDFPAVVALFAERREALIASQLRTFVHLVRFEPGHIEFRQQPQAPRDLANRVGQLLGEWTGRRWVVAVSSARGEATLTEREAAAEAALKDEAARHPAVKAVLDAFPGAKILEVRDLEPLAQAVAAPDLGDTTDMPMADEDAADEEGDL
ncbi:MAG: DNA polymerase III subunit gamma/tau [Rhodospirillales bacterium]